MIPLLSPEFARDAGCRANLVWRCDLLEARHAASFVEAATEAAFELVAGATRMGVAVFEEARSGHRVLVVLRTGRVQVRLDALTDPEVRVDEARRVFDRLALVGR